MNNFINEGDKLTLTAPSGGVVSGTPLLIGTSLFGVPEASAAVGALFCLLIRGVFTLVKATGVTFAIGDTVYWDDSAHKVTSDATKLPIGLALEVAGSSATTLEVNVYPCASTNVELDAVVAGLAGHIADTTAAHAGTAISFSPAGTIAATTVQAALEEVSGDVTGIANRMAGIYQITFTGANSTGGNATISPTVKGTAVPAVGDRILGIVGIVTASNVFAGMPVIGTDFAALLLLDTTVKVQQKQAAGDLSANTYLALVLPA